MKRVVMIVLATLVAPSVALAQATTLTGKVDLVCAP